MAPQFRQHARHHIRPRRHHRHRQALRQQLVTDPHSPALYRVNGSVRNLEAWYVAFDVQEGDALYLPPEERIVIW